MTSAGSLAGLSDASSPRVTKAMTRKRDEICSNDRGLGCCFPRFHDSAAIWEKDIHRIGLRFSCFSFQHMETSVIATSNCTNWPMMGRSVY
jgi:hypothetical protein